MQSNKGSQQRNFNASLVNSALFISVAILALPIKAELIIQNNANPNTTVGLSETPELKQDGYYYLNPSKPNQQIQIGAYNGDQRLDPPVIMLINNGYKMKSAQTLIGNHRNGNGVVMLEGEGTRWQINGSLNIGTQGSEGKLYIKDGAQVLQYGEQNDANYLAHPGDLRQSNHILIHIEGENSSLSMDNAIKSYSISHNKIVLTKQGSLNLNTTKSVALNQVENAGHLNVNGLLIIRKDLQIGSDSEAGHFHFAKGVALKDDEPFKDEATFRSDPTLLIKQLASDGLEMPIVFCNGCNIQYEAPQHLILKYTNKKAEFRPKTFTITQGNVEIKDELSFHKLQAKSADLQANGSLTLNQIRTNATEEQAKFNLLTHAGRLDLADGTDTPAFMRLDVENYVADGGTLLIDSAWQETTGSLNSDLLHISKSLIVNKPVIIQTKNGITHKVEEREDKLAVLVDIEHDGEAFIGKANTQNAGIAYIVKKANNYYWSLGKTGEEFMIAGAAGYIQMPHSNLELIYNNIGSLQARRGIDFIHNLPTKAAWGRIWQENIQEDGQRFEQQQKQYIAQVGYDFLHVENTHTRSQTGVYTTFAYNDLKFFDPFYRINGVTRANTYVGKGKTQANMFGLYHSLIHKNGSYIDVVANLSYLHNSYQSVEDKRVKNHAQGLAFSAEVGHRVQTEQSPWLLVPQAQLVYQYVHLTGFQAQDKSIRQGHQQGLRARIGARLTYQPNPKYAFSLLANVYRELKQTSRVNIGSASYGEHYAKTWFDAGVLLQMRLSPQLSLYADLRSGKSFRQQRTTYRGMLGMEYRW